MVIATIIKPIKWVLNLDDVKEVTENETVERINVMPSTNKVYTMQKYRVVNLLIHSVINADDNNPAKHQIKLSRKLKPILLNVEHCQIINGAKSTIKEKDQKMLCSTIFPLRNPHTTQVYQKKEVYEN